MYLSQVQQRFESIGWTVEKVAATTYNYEIWSNEHSPGMTYCCQDLKEVQSYFGECRERAGMDYQQLEFHQTDGGRQAAGYKGRTGDCVTRAAAVVLRRLNPGLSPEQAYQQAYDRITELNRQIWERSPKKQRQRKTAPTARVYTYKKATRQLMEELGGEWTPTMQIGSGCQVHMRADELPGGLIVAKVSKHVAAVIDHVVYDSHNPAREGTRCVYGYWKFE